MRPRWAAAATAALVVLALVVAAGVLWLWRRPDGVVTPGLSVTAAGTVGTPVTGSKQFSVDGDTRVRIEVSRISGGTASLAAGPSPSLPDAVRFPAYRATGAYPRAVLSLTPTSGGSLTPGVGNFSYGAVLELDARSSGRAEDNGDNVFQRGLSSEQDLFKLEMDHGRPACAVRGSAGTVVVRARTTVTPGAWYTVTCRRVGDRVTVSAIPYATGGQATAATVATRSETGSIGAVTFAAGRPASVGGKLLPSDAVLRTASDQFNGAIATVWTRPS